MRTSTGRYFAKETAAYWDGRNDDGEQVASCTYFYYLQAGDFKSAKRMVLRK